MPAKKKPIKKDDPGDWDSLYNSDISATTTTPCDGGNVISPKSEPKIREMQNKIIAEKLAQINKESPKLDYGIRSRDPFLSSLETSYTITRWLWYLVGIIILACIVFLVIFYLI